MSFPTTLPHAEPYPLRGGAVLRWGIVAPGRIAGNFVRALRGHTDQRVTAVGSRSVQRAEAFAREHDIERAYGDYAQLLADPLVDVVYIAAPHSEHRGLALLAIAAGKHVLVEKPLALSAAQAREIAAAARAAGVFAMEAMWSRYQPQNVVIERLLADGVLGEVRMLTADFGVHFEVGPEDRVLNPDLGGGALLDLGVYPVWFAHFALGVPRRILASGSLTSTGVDGQSSAILDYASGAQAIVSTNLFAEMTNTASINGTAARIEVDGTFLFASGFDLVSVDGTRLRFDDPGLSGGDGLAWQAVGVAQHIADGLTESPWHPLDVSVAVLESLDAIRAQLG